MIGLRVNFSARNVIVPLIGKYKIDEIIIPYITFLQLFQFEIINLIYRLDKITLNEAFVKWNAAMEKFDRRIYLICKYLIKNTKNGLHVLINRNPTLSYGSILSMRVVDIKNDIEDLTMSVPINVLTLIGGDFDGDVLNIISLKDQTIIKNLDEIFNPNNLWVDRNNGSFNTKMCLIKDQACGLYSFANS